MRLQRSLRREDGSAGTSGTGSSGDESSTLPPGGGDPSNKAQQDAIAKGFAAARAKQSSLKYPRDSISGAFYPIGEGYDGAEPLTMSSGGRNVPEDYVPPAGAIEGYEAHLEAQSAAYMRDNGISEGVLFHTGTYTCLACDGTLPDMLPRNSELHIYYYDSSGELQYRNYVGRS